jgi:hypothetical protein
MFRKAGYDMIGGATGGIAAAWILRDLHVVALTLSSTLLLLLMAATYLGIEGLSDWVDERLQIREEPQPTRERANWPKNRAS